MEFELKNNSFIRFLIVACFTAGVAAGLWLATYKVSHRYVTIIQNKNETIELLVEEVKNECSELYMYSKELEKERNTLKETVRDFRPD
jgi:hypothetical protein